MKTKDEILADIVSAKKSKKDFYRNCLNFIEYYNFDIPMEQYIRETITQIKAKIKVLTYRRKSDKSIYKDELKSQRLYLKSLKYVLNETKGKKSRTSRPIRKSSDRCEEVTLARSKEN